MHVSGHRQERVADEIRTLVAEIISLELKDPRIGFATVTRVDLSPDLHSARVFVSVLGSEDERRQTLEGLSSSAGYLRRQVGRCIRLRRVPELSFVLDRGPEESARLEALLAKIHRQE
jgi:ribosome-binding factor A